MANVILNTSEVKFFLCLRMFNIWKKRFFLSCKTEYHCHAAVKLALFVSDFEMGEGRLHLVY